MDEKKPPGKRAPTRSRARSDGPAASDKNAAGSSARPRAARGPKAPAAASKAARPKRVSLPPPERVDPSAIRRESAKKVALAVALAALDKKAERVEIVDIGEKVDYADYLVVMTGRSDRQVVAIAQAIEEALNSKGVKTNGREGVAQGHWVLIDIGDVIAHVFLDEARRYYDLEGLWIDAPRVPTPSFTPPPPTSAHES